MEPNRHLKRLVTSTDDVDKALAGAQPALPLACQRVRVSVSPFAKLDHERAGVAIVAQRCELLGGGVHGLELTVPGTHAQNGLRELGGLGGADGDEQSDDHLK